MTRHLQRTVAAIGMALLATLAARGATAEPASGAYVVAVNNPLAYFAERIASGAIEVRLPVPPGTDPAFWRPTVDDILLLQGAQRLLLNGAGYSPWLNRAALSQRRQVLTTTADSWIQVQNQVTHSHGPTGEHAHGGYATTTWLDLELAATQAASVADALASLLPEEALAIAGRLAELQRELRALDDGYRRCAADLAFEQLIYSHPVYQYFERRYGLAGKSLHWEPDALPGDDQWRRLEAMLSPRTLFVWEAEPAAAIAARMLAMNLSYVVIDPAANRGDKDWLAVQRGNLESLAQFCDD
jgi:zinc transport system substrate-binding protein